MGKWAGKESGRRAPLEQGRDGLMENHTASILAQMGREGLQEGIDDLDAINDAPVLHIFGEKYATASLPGTVKHQSIPE